MPRILIAAITALSVATLAPAATRDAPPRLAAQSFDALPKPLPLPYDEGAKADAAVAAASRRARAARKLLLIDLGGNWCLDCRLLAGTIELPQLAPWVQRHFEVVTVDVGRFDKNLQIPARYGKPKLKGVPAVLIVDPRTGRLVNRGREEALADARSMSPQALADWLAQWAQ